jgi:outer membrane protein
MKGLARMLAILAGLAGGHALAQQPEATATPVAAAAPEPRAVHLLDEVPDYAEVLAHQWSAGVPADVTAAEQSTEQYGRLGTQPLQATSLTECIGLALQNNTDLQIQRLGPVGAAAQVRSARAIFDPVLFGDVSRDRRQTPAVSVLTGGNPNVELSTVFNQNLNIDAGIRKTLLSGGLLSLSWQNNKLVATQSIVNPLVPQYTTSLGLSLNQPLLRDFGWNHALLLVEIAQNTEQAAYRQYEASIATIVSQVERAYWSLVLAIQAVHVQEQAVTLAREVQRQNEGKFNVGALPQTAVLEAKSEVARREAILIQAQNFSDNARDNLRALINFRRPEDAALLMIDPQDEPVVVPYSINLDRSLRVALEQRPELLAARLTVHTQGLQRKVAENQLLPKLNFAGQLGLNGLSGTGHEVALGQTNIPPPIALDGGYGRSVDLLADGRFYSYAAGATIEIPIDNAQAKAGYAQANINLEQSRLSLQKVEETVTLEIKTAVSNLESDLKSIDATRLARELAEENVRNQQARYNVGLATTKDLLDFQDRLTQARFAEVQALTTYNTDLAEMRRVEGSLLSARNVLLERVSLERAPWWASF